jgi:hypothetical protein
MQTLTITVPFSNMFIAGLLAGNPEDAESVGDVCGRRKKDITKYMTRPLNISDFNTAKNDSVLDGSLWFC